MYVGILFEFMIIIRFYLVNVLCGCADCALHLINFSNSPDFLFYFFLLGLLFLID